MEEEKAREQNTSTGAPTGPKPLDFAMDDRLKLSLQYAIQHSDKKQSNDHSSKAEDGSKVENGPPAKDKAKVQDDGYGSRGRKSVSRLRKCKTYSHEKPLKKSNYRRGDIDTTAPFESVKAAVSMFGGIDWKAHKLMMAERRKNVAQELSKAHEEIQLFKKKSEAAEESKEQVLKELDSAKRHLEQLKLDLERAQTEDEQAKQDAQLMKLRLEEMEQGIADECSVAAKVQLEVAQGRHQSAVSELEAVTNELQNLQKDYDLLLSDRDLAIKDADEAVYNSNETEKNVEDLTIKLITTKEALESVQGEHLEAEEHRITTAMAGEEELKQSEEELENVNQQMAETEDLESKHDTASVLVQDLKATLASYLEKNHKDIQSAVDLSKINLDKTKKNIERVTDEVNNLKIYADSLKSKLEHEKQKRPTPSLEDELERTYSELAGIQKKEQEALEKMTKLPKQLQEAIEEADCAKSRARKAHKELKKATKAANRAKNGENTINMKLSAALKEIEAARASERLAVGAMNAQESESARSNEGEPESGITVSAEKYDELSRKAKEAEDEANDRVSEAISQIDLAKMSEVKAVKKLEEVKCDLASKKEQLSKSIGKVEKAKEGKMAVEQELRIWRSENEQRRRKAEEDDDDSKMETKNGIGSSKPQKKKKRSRFFLFLFLCRKKGHSKKKNK